MEDKPLTWDNINPFKKSRNRRAKLGQLLGLLKNENGKSSFDEILVEFLETLLEYDDNRLSF